LINSVRSAAERVEVALVSWQTQLSPLVWQSVHTSSWQNCVQSSSHHSHLGDISTNITLSSYTNEISRTLANYHIRSKLISLQCSDTVGWATGRASSL